MAEDVAQIEADGSDSDTCHSERGEGIGPAKWGHRGSQTCSTIVSVFKSPCAATLFFSLFLKKWGWYVLCATWKARLLPSLSFPSLGPGCACKMN